MENSSCMPQTFFVKQVLLYNYEADDYKLLTFIKKKNLWIG